MRFWDTSAVVPLCVEEPQTTVVDALLSADEGMAVWWATPVECASAFARLRRAGGLTAQGEQAARELAAEYRRIWTEIHPSAALREYAIRLIAVHELRAADSLQLAAAAKKCQRHTSCGTYSRLATSKNWEAIPSNSWVALVRPSRNSSSILSVLSSDQLPSGSSKLTER